MHRTSAKRILARRPFTYRVTRSVGLGVVLATIAVGAVVASSQAIISAGPLTRVEVSDVLNCAVDHASDAVPEFYGDTACGTLIATGGILYRPDTIPAGGSAAPFTPYTVVSQTAVTGAGTIADPFTITTVVDLGATGLRAIETDTYVVGQEAYRTDVTVQNNGAQSTEAILYRAGDCFLQNSDNGFGAVNAANGSVSCVGSSTDGGGLVPGDRIEQWYPLSSGSSYYHANYSEVWAWIGTQQPFPNTCRCAEYIDNGAGLSWSLAIPSGQSVTRSHLTVFSPVGIEPLTTTKTAASATTAAGGSNSYTISIANPNDVSADLASITDTLPAGFTYSTGSTTGASTTDPSIAGQMLTWAGPFSVPADGVLTLAFGVTVSSVAGTYTNDAGGTGLAQFIVLPSGPTAPVTITDSPPVNPPPAANAGPDTGGPEGSPINLDGTVANEPGTDSVTQAWSYVLGAGTDPGMSCAFGDAAAADTTITCTDDGQVTVTLTANDGVNPLVADSAAISVTNASPTIEITAPADGASVSVGAVVNVAAARADPGGNDTHSCSIDWGDGTTSAGTLTATSCTGSHTYTSIQTPTVRVTITDDDGASASDEIMLVVAQAQTKVTGGGWVDLADGRLRLGLVAQPTGATAEGQIQVRWGAHKFHGKTVTGLVVTKPSASWSGSGRFDGVDGFFYDVRIIDNGNGGGKHRTPDRFAFTIRDGSGAVVFTMSGTLGGGNLVVH